MGTQESVVILEFLVIQDIQDIVEFLVIQEYQAIQVLGILDIVEVGIQDIRE